MKTEQYFTVGKHNISWTGDTFKNNFNGMSFTIPKNLKLQYKVLEKPMLDKDIFDQWKPQESTLGELAWALEHDKDLLKNGYANIFYIRDKNNTLWAVRAYWFSSNLKWHVDACSVSYPFGWDAGRRVVSQGFSEIGNLDSRNLEGKILEINGIKYKLLKQ